jgi:hypothetical protein
MAAVMGIWLGLTGAVPALAGLRRVRQLDRDGAALAAAGAAIAIAAP